MEDRPTCGKGLAEHSALPEKLGELVGSVAEILEVHTEALDMTDENSRIEHAAYSELAESHRRIAAELTATAKRMAGYRELPMGRHDEAAMSGPRPVEAFDDFVTLERELAALLRDRLEEDQAMLAEMQGARRE